MINKSIEDLLLKLHKEHNIFLEGNLLKVLVSVEGTEFHDYLVFCNKKDKDIRTKRLTVLKDVQEQNKKLILAQKENVKINTELQELLESTKKSKERVELDLYVLTKKNQNELLNLIIKTALFIIVGIGATTALMYGLAIYNDRETVLIGAAWSNMFNITLTSSFTIIGTIMGVKTTTNKE